MYYLFAKEFGWTPKQVDKQDVKKIKGISILMATYNKIINERAKSKSKSKNKIVSGLGR